MVRLLLSVYTFLYRLTGGVVGGRMAGLNVLLLTTTGRKTGKQRTTPLGYFEDDGRFVIIASNGGAERNPGWFYNLQSQPLVSLQIRSRQLAARAEPANPDERRRLWAKLVKLSPAYGKYATKTRREIPLILLRPV